MTSQATPAKQNERGAWTSASNAAADRQCEGRHNAQRGIPETSSEDAKFGNEIHEALRTDDPSKLTTDQLSIYESCIEIRERKAREFFGADYEKMKVIKEQRLWVKVKVNPNDKGNEPDRFPHSGQADIIMRVGDRALIPEYKTLPGDVPSSPENEQLRDLVVLGARSLVLREVGTMVVQPLVTQNPVICLYTKDHIDKAEKEMHQRVRNSNNPEAKRTAGTVACKFCRAKLSCGEYQKWVGSMVPDTTTIVTTPVTQWTPEMRAHFCHMLPSAQAWLEVCKAEMKRLLKEDANAVPGWYLADGDVRRPVNNPQELFTRFAGLSKEWAAQHAFKDPLAEITKLFMACVSIRKEDLDAIVRKVTGLKGKALKTQIDALLAGITDEVRSQSSLAKKKE